MGERSIDQAEVAGSNPVQASLFFRRFYKAYSEEERCLVDKHQSGRKVKGLDSGI